jgi:hypothetical protein
MAYEGSIADSNVRLLWGEIEMIQTDSFGRFNADIQKFDGIERDMIIYCSTKLRDALVNVSKPEYQFYELDTYIELIIKDYRSLAHMIRSVYHW